MLIVLRPITLSLLALSSLAAVAFSAVAQEKKPDSGSILSSTADELTPEEKAERESRKACKVVICSAFHNRKPDGGDIACDVIKSWRKEQLDKMVSKAKVSWPWGRVACVTKVKLKRVDLIKAMVEPKFEATFDKHEVKCTIDRDTEPKADINFDFAPKVTFEKGKAVKAQLNWGKIEAPTLVKGAMWTATASDNTFNVLQSTIVEDINDFVDKKCMEVKEDWAGK